MNFKKIADTSFKSVGDSFLSSVTKMFHCILKEKQPSEQWEKVIHHLVLYCMISNNVLTVYGFESACYAYRMLAYKMNCFI